jgi:hypothetical protein
MAARWKVKKISEEKLGYYRVDLRASKRGKVDKENMMCELEIRKNEFR